MELETMTDEELAAELAAVRAQCARLAEAQMAIGGRAVRIQRVLEARQVAAQMREATVDSVG